MSPAPLTSGQLQTRIRYELVATGQGFYREQRVGYWQLMWERSTSGEFRIRTWQALDETQSRYTASAPAYLDIAAAALGGTASYSAQLLHGTDYWRTVLDGACGIDVYGHNGVSVGDIDGDGYDDLYICQPGGLPNRLYRNRGDGTFEDITETSGVGVIENTACALIVDIDNDGRQDLNRSAGIWPDVVLEPRQRQISPERERISFRHSPARHFYRSRSGRLRPRRLARYLFLPLCLLPGHRTSTNIPLLIMTPKTALLIS